MASSAAAGPAAGCEGFLELRRRNAFYVSIAAALSLVGPASSLAESSQPEDAKHRFAATAIKRPVDRSLVKIESLLGQSGGLPPGYSAAKIRHSAPGMSRGVPATERTTFQPFARNGRPAGGVSVFLYKDKSKTMKAYSAILSGIADAKPIANIGEKAALHTLKFSAGEVAFTGVEMAFIRCKSVVHLRFAGTTDVVAVRSYARRIDAKLSELVCVDRFAYLQTHGERKQSAQ
jgi:hypothetical protein